MEKIIELLTTENELMYNIVAYPLTVLEIFILVILIKTIYKVQPTKKQTILFILLCTILGCSVRILLPMPYNFVVNFALITILIFIILRISLFKSLISFSIFSLSTALAELLITIFLSQVLQLNLEAACNTPLIQIICRISIFMIILSLLKLITIFKTNLDLSDSINNTEKFKLTFNILIAIVIVYPNVIFLIMKDMQIPTYYIVYNLITALVLFFVTTYNTHRFNKLEITKRELETANLYNKTLSQLVDMNRSFKHDINNIIQAIGGYIELNDMSGLKTYYKTGLLPDINKVNNLSLLNPDTINSPPVFGLLLSKYNLAISKNITFNITSFFDYSTINMNIFDFVKILGILLDNAIEASSESKEKIVELYITIDFYSRKQIFKVNNSYSNKDIDLNQIFNKDYSTKKEKSGFGLWEVKQIVNKAKNLSIQPSKNDLFVTQKLEIKF